MTDLTITRRLQAASRRVLRYRLWVGLGVVWMTVSLVGAAIWSLDLLLDVAPQTLVFALGGIGAVLSIAWSVFLSLRVGSEQTIARRIEASFPSLRSTLLTAVEQKPAANGQLSFLQQEVIGRAREHSRRHDWRQVVPNSRMLLAACTNAAGLLAAATVLLGLSRTRSALASLPAATEKETPAATTSLRFLASIEPGDVELERGTDLLVTARFQEAIPPEASLLWHPWPENIDETTTVARAMVQPMTRSLDDPLFATRVASVEESIEYSVKFGDQQSSTYRVTVFDYPRLEQADATLTYPEYTTLAPRHVHDVRRVTAIRGTSVRLFFQLNKPVRSATLVPLAGDDNSTEQNALVSTKDATAEIRFQLLESARYQLILKDDQGRENRSPPVFTFKAVSNAEPQIRLVRPKRDVSVSPIEELDLHATVWDDFGVTRAGLSYAVAGDTETEVSLADRLPAKSKSDLKYRLRFEELGVSPDDLVSFYFWAEDVAPSGDVRRTLGDMYFAEVRPFDEIVRQGTPQPPSSGQPPPGGPSQQAAELVELQKQIITASWKVIRRETGTDLSQDYGDDVALLAESQESAIAMLSELMAELTDERSVTFAQLARERMQDAAAQYTGAIEPSNRTELKVAMRSAQEAYQALLKLRAREHEIVRQQQSKSQSSSSSRAEQEKLSELELNNIENRYEAQSQATPEESAQEREDRQVLSRLRELARRQDDLNERMQELQSALDAAISQEDRDEAERQLKRLREEQQQIIRDAEELAERMNSSENQQRMGEQREQLESARESAREASQALKEGQVSRAAAEGTRAEETLSELKNDFQKRTSNALVEQVRSLAEQLETVVAGERELSEKLKPQERSARPSLREAGPTAELNNDFQKQRERIASLKDQMRRTLEDAEEAEQTLVAEKLYEAIRSTRQRPPEEALRRSEQAFDRGLIDDARELERIASAGIDQLGEGIQQAVESVLSDETESLRRARQELQRLSDELDNELARNGQPPRQPTGNNEPTPSQQGTSNPSDTMLDSAGDGDSQAHASSQSQRSNAGNEDGDRQPGSRTESESTDRVPGDGSGVSNTSGERQPDSGERQQASASGRGEPTPDGMPAETSGQGTNADSETQGKGQTSQEPQSNAGTQRPSNRPSLRSAQGASGASETGTTQGGLARGGGSNQRMINRTNRDTSPIAGDDFLDWSDRLRDVEEILTDPALRSRAASIRDRAKEIRKEVRRQSADPNWDVVQEMLAEPLSELEQDVRAELLRRTSDDLVPLDRTPVPKAYESQVREYYRQLGIGR